MPRGLKNPLCFKLPDRFVGARRRAGLQLNQLSAMAELSQPAAGLIEKGLRTPTIDTIERLAAALGVSAGWLAYGYEGSEPFRERFPRPLFPPPDPAPEDMFRTFRNMNAGFPDRLAIARERSGLSMRALSAAAGISVQGWSNAEAGRAIPRVDTAERMAVALGVPASWLAFGEDPN